LVEKAAWKLDEHRRGSVFAGEGAARGMAIDPSDLAQTADLTFADAFDHLDLWRGGDDTGWATDFFYNPLHGKGYSFADQAEQEWYINVNYGPTKNIRPWSVSDGILSITASEADAATQALLGGYAYTSGSLNTYHSFSQLYGYFEMRAKLPAGQGLWPAFWLLPEDGSWPPELDVMEVLGNAMTQLHLTSHSGASGHHTQKSTNVTVADMSKHYHTYGVDWEADRITWCFDHQKVWSVKTPADMNKAMYMVVNLAVGGYWPGNADDTTHFPATLKIDYIRAYQSLPEIDLTLKADGTAHQILEGGTGDDTFKAGDNSVVMTGFAGDDTFVFGAVPKHAGHITDFTPGADKVDVAALLHEAHYHGTHPFADGYLKLTHTAAGNMRLYFDDDGAKGPHEAMLLTRLDHLSPSDLHKGDFILTHATQHMSDVAPNAATPDDAATSPPDNGSSFLERVVAAVSHMPSDFLFG
jgi:beta-glucanase (GH16 family)